MSISSLQYTNSFKFFMQFCFAIISEGLTIWNLLSTKKLELLHNRRDGGIEKFSKIFSRNDPSRGKNMRGIRIWHFRSEKNFRKGLCIEATIRFWPKNDPFGVKMCGKIRISHCRSEKNTSLIQGRLVYWSEKSQKCDF